MVATMTILGTGKKVEIRKKYLRIPTLTLYSVFLYLYVVLFRRLQMYYGRLLPFCAVVTLAQEQLSTKKRKM